jgi:Predicted membrane protein (DUF2254)/MMPL family
VFTVAVLLVSLGSDYNVFLVGRIWQEGRRRALRDAVEVAGSRAARPITVAGLVLALFFALLAIVGPRSAWPGHALRPAQLVAREAPGGQATPASVPEPPSAAASRSTLTVLGEGIATIVGISFSITVAALQLVSQQFSPRALHSFLADRVTQVMTGFFVGTFGYSLVVLQVVHGPTPSKDAFVPTASSSVAILLGLVSLAVLPVFFHHMVRTLQVAERADIARSTLGSLDRLYRAVWRSGRGGPATRPRCVAIRSKTVRRGGVAARMSRSTVWKTSAR